MANKSKSIEPDIVNLANRWLDSYGLDIKYEQASLNSEIQKALQEYESKSGGKGGNRPDAKLIMTDQFGNDYPVLIEYKGYKNKLVKLKDGQVINKNNKNEFDYSAIKSYAVNGAVHYANAILQYTSYTDVIAIGMTGYKENNKINCEIGVYYVSKDNFGAGQEIAKYSDLSFLKPENQADFFERIRNLSLTDEERDKIKQKREEEIDASLTKLNNDIYVNEKGLSESDRVYLVVAAIMATLGVKDSENPVKPLEKSELRSSMEEGYKDGDMIMRKIKSFLGTKKIPLKKQQSIIRMLENTITAENLNKAVNGETRIKRIFNNIVDDLGIYYKIGLTTDFTGKLFNEMYRWLGFTQDKLNDVVLTPPYVATLLVKLARVTRKSYVWDFATGSAGLLVAAMNEMIIDVKNNVHSPEEQKVECAKIRTEKLLGLEILPSVYMLAVLNMILMGDGSSNIMNEDSLNDFDGNYGYEKKKGKFPADAFVLNPPYSAPGCGMIFVETALSMMNSGYAAIIIQNSAGNGQAVEYNRRILKTNALLASIKMPIDLFVGRSSVQAYIYVFRVGEKHEKDDVVKFIDFSNDGYARCNRKKAKSSVNLKNVDRAKERYQEIVDLVRFGKSKLNIFTENEYYEGVIDPENGGDWNQSAPVDTVPSLDDFKKTVGDYLAFEVSNLLKNSSEDITAKK